MLSFAIGAMIIPVTERGSGDIGEKWIQRTVKLYGSRLNSHECVALALSLVLGADVVYFDSCLFASAYLYKLINPYVSYINIINTTPTHTLHTCETRLLNFDVLPNLKIPRYGRSPNSSFISQPTRERS